MNLRLVQFKLAPGSRAEAESIADRVAPVVRAQSGCERCEFFADDEAGDYGMIVLWASKQHADAATSVVGPVLLPALTQASATAQSIRLFDLLGQPAPTPSLAAAGSAG